VQATVAVLRTFEAFHDIGIFVELLLLDGHIDSDDVLPYDAPGTDIQMPTGEPAFVRMPGKWKLTLTRLQSYPSGHR
jgi:hypothetical protein